MKPDYDRLSDADKSNVQALVEIPLLEDAPISDPLESGTDIKTSQEHTTQKRNKHWTIKNNI